MRKPFKICVVYSCAKDKGFIVNTAGTIVDASCHPGYNILVNTRDGRVRTGSSFSGACFAKIFSDRHVSVTTIYAQIRGETCCCFGCIEAQLLEGSSTSLFAGIGVGLNALGVVSDLGPLGSNLTQTQTSGFYASFVRCRDAVVACVPRRFRDGFPIRRPQSFFPVTCLLEPACAFSNM